jgi:hypothetical protein
MKKILIFIQVFLNLIKSVNSIHNLIYDTGDFEFIFIFEYIYCSCMPFLFRTKPYQTVHNRTQPFRACNRPYSIIVS